VKKAARKKATKVAITKTTNRRPFPYQRVLKMWKGGKTLETIARATGRFQKDADDPLRSFRVSLTRFHKGVRQVRRERNALKRRQSEPLLNLTNDFLPEVIFNKFRVACPTQHPRLVGYRTNSLNCGVLQNNPPLL